MKKNSLKFFLAFAISCSFLTACKKEETTPANNTGGGTNTSGGGTTTGNIYVLTQQGSIWQTSNTTTRLSAKSSLPFTEDIFISGNDIYVVGAGNQRVSPNFPDGVAGSVTLWKNGIPTYITDENKYAEARSIFVSGNDVYIAGFEGILNSHNKYDVNARLWKNGSSTPLSLILASSSSRANSVYVYKDDVYVAGSDAKGATLWKNGIASILSFSNNSDANCVYVSDGDVYVVGYEVFDGGKRIAKLWKNGKPTNLSDGTKETVANAVCVSGNDVYIVGYESNGTKKVAKLWKNGIVSTLPAGTRDDVEAKDVIVSGSDVYVLLNWGGVVKNGISFFNPLFMPISVAMAIKK
jgi:hypothetical protein